MPDVITAKTKVKEIERIFDLHNINFGRGLDMAAIIVLQGLFQKGQYIVVDGFSSGAGGEGATFRAMSRIEYKEYLESEVPHA